MAGDHEDAFCWEGTSASAGADAASGEAGASLAVPPASAPRRRGRVAAAAAVVAAAAVAAVLLLTIGSGAPQTVLARVADVTSSEPGYRMAMTMNLSAAGQTFTLEANGRFNTLPPNGTLTMSFAGQQLNEILDGQYAYLQVPSLSPRWDRLSLASLAKSTQTSGVDVQQTIAFLRTVGTVTTVGSEVTDGVPTTHYHAEIDVSRLADALPVKSSSTSSGISALEQALGNGGLPLDVWVDAQDRVRRMTMSIDAAQMSLALTMTLSDYGPQPRVSPPPADQVQDLGSFGQQVLTD